MDVLRVIKFDGSNNKELEKKTNYNLDENNFDKII